MLTKKRKYKSLHPLCNAAPKQFSKVQNQNHHNLTKNRYKEINNQNRKNK